MKRLWKLLLSKRMVNKETLVEEKWIFLHVWTAKLSLFSFFLHPTPPVHLCFKCFSGVRSPCTAASCSGSLQHDRSTPCFPSGMQSCPSFLSEYLPLSCGPGSTLSRSAALCSVLVRQLKSYLDVIWQAAASDKDELSCLSFDTL